MQDWCRLTKFVSNSKELIISIPWKDRRQQAPDKRLLETIPDNEKSLGVFWNIEDDKVGFQVHMKKKPLTRRGMLPSLSSICDPLALAAPFMLEGRRVTQSLCHQNLDWYEQIPDSMARYLAAWKSNLLLLEYIKVQDVLNPRNLVKLENTVCIIFLMHQSMDMVSVATFKWLMKMIKFIAVRWLLDNQEWYLWSISPFRCWN